MIVGPTGGGRSSLIEACLYDAAHAGLDVAYLGYEITEEEFNARAAQLATCRDDDVDGELREMCARARYLDLPSVIAHAWQKPDVWINGMSARYRVIGLDPLSSVMVPFLEMEPPYEDLKELSEAIWDLWGEHGNNRERVGEFIQRVGLGNFLEQIGLDPQPQMVVHPRTNPYIFFELDEEDEG